jgi:hypothetical protein
MNNQLNDFIKPLKGRVEIFDDKGNKIRDVNNLILGSTRLAILYNLFRDPKILATGITEGYFKKSTNDAKKNYIPTICGFMFGCNGANVSNPSILRVPSPRDNFTSTGSLDNNSTSFIPVSLLSLASTSGEMLNTSGSFQNVDEFITNPVISSSVISNQETSTVKYFTPDSLEDEGNYYCKAINTSNSSISIDSENYEIEYIIKFEIGPYDLIGKSFNEIGLVLANCDLTNGVITDVDTSTVVLASRLTFDEISLSRQLLASFNIRYHIYI